jgi:hypothetical protein
LNPSTPKSVSPTGEDALLAAQEVARRPTYSAPVIVDLVSNVAAAVSDAQFTVEGPIFQPTKLQITLKNHIGVAAKVRLVPRVFQLIKENGTPVQQKQTVQEQVLSLIKHPVAETVQSDLTVSAFENLVRNHKMFVFEKKEVDFTDGSQEVSLGVEFIPITLGTFRCLVLFIDEKQGEFVVEITAKTLPPAPAEVASAKIKAMAGQRCSFPIPLELLNVALTKAIAYSIEKDASTGTYCAEQKLNDAISRRQRDVDNMFKQAVPQTSFRVENSAPQYFEISKELTLVRVAPGTTAKAGMSAGVNVLPIVFAPPKPGDYPCKVVMNSKYDLRILSFRGIGLTATKEMQLEFTAVAGKPVKQEIPLQNPSNDSWSYKVTVSGDSCFSAPPKLVVKPGSTEELLVTCAAMRIGEARGELTLFNLRKEFNVIYRLHATIAEPPAEDKIVVRCQARKKMTVALPIKSPLLKGQNIVVSSTVPIIQFPAELQFFGGEPLKPFQYTIFASRSGVSAGTLTFTDVASKSYIWYVLEIHVDSPDPEETIEVTTVARKCVTVTIPITNPKSVRAEFSVVLSDETIFGAPSFVVEGGDTKGYQIIVSPLTVTKQTSSVIFFSEDEGEFWYALKIEATEAPPDPLAPVSSPLGKATSTYIDLENPLDKAITFRVENDNQTAFHVVAKRVIQFSAKEKRRIEVRYIPTSIGVKETATLTFRSNEIGHWVFLLSGTGKPPQPLSPILVSSIIDTSNSALVLFTNPFPCPARFSVSLNSETDPLCFKLLIRRRMFSLASFGEEFQIPFTFTPKAVGQFSGTIVVAYLGPARSPLPDLNALPAIHWMFPIVGSCAAAGTIDTKAIKCKANSAFASQFTFSLFGERDIYQFSEYSVSVTMPSGYEFLASALQMQPVNIKRQEGGTELVIDVKFYPQRPVNLTARALIKNPSGQEWEFEASIVVEPGKPLGSLVIESLLHKTGTLQVSIPNVIRSIIAFHAYFVQGSAQEFTVMPEHGFIEPPIDAGESDQILLPVTVVFAPQMYGKVLKGLLVIDTIENQFLFEVFRKTPDCVPPTIPSGTELGNLLSADDTGRMKKKKKRNIVKENIESAKSARPLPSPHPRRQ